MTKRAKRIVLTAIEIEALLGAAQNVNPCMFTEDVGGKEGERLFDAWERGVGKLQDMLAQRRGEA